MFASRHFHGTRVGRLGWWKTRSGDRFPAGVSVMRFEEIFLEAELKDGCRFDKDIAVESSASNRWGEAARLRMDSFACSKFC